MRIIMSLLFTMIIVSALSCDTTEPPEKENRILTWEVDTIAYPGSFQTKMRTIWGNTGDDLWIAGHNNRGFGKAYHYDGKEWKDFLPVQPERNILDTYNFYISLNLADEVFLCGNALNLEHDTSSGFTHSSLILSHRNNQWNISQLGEGKRILSISGKKSGKLYASGWDLTLFSYENNHWARKYVDYLIPQNYETESINSVLVDHNQNAYMIILVYDQNPLITYNYFVREINNEWVKVDSFDVNSGNSKWGLNFWKSPQGKIYSFNPGIYEYNHNNWISIFDQNKLITTMKGTSSNNIFAAGRGVFHFNGKEWYEYEDLYYKYGLARDILLLEDQVFILFSNSAKSFVLKGRLSNK